ncbi:MAG: phosphotransferase [Acidobacteria bacterium]|nr:phosphotransferase [Acidobacteriota bacterium]MBI3662679.1 phosphotransferase [Acidobacteriota bacterium]
MPELTQSPAEVGIPTLPAVMNPTELGRHLAPYSAGLWAGKSPQELRVRALRCHPESRCTVEINVRIDGGWRQWIGKVFATDRLDIYQAMEGIREVGFGEGEEFSIPRPLLYLRSLHLLLQERVPGPRAEEIFVNGDARQRASAGERCARWLARFHRSAPRVGPVSDLKSLMVAIERWTRRIEQRGGSFGGKLARLFRQLEERATSVVPVELCAGHGSYSASHVILANGRTVTFDWDGYDVADPARDVARFIVALRRLAYGRLHSVRALDDVADVFQRTYKAEGPPQIEANLSFHKASVCLKLAKYVLSKPVSDQHKRIEAMLDEGLRFLEQ